MTFSAHSDMQSLPRSRINLTKYSGSEDVRAAEEESAAEAEARKRRAFIVHELVNMSLGPQGKLSWLKGKFRISDGGGNDNGTGDPGTGASSGDAGC